MKSLKILLLLITFIQINSQTRSFEFTFCGREQKVKLFQKNETKYRGIIKTTFYKKKSNREITKITRIKKETVKKIITQISTLDIYNLNDKSDKIDCGDFYLDGDHFSVKISEEKLIFEKTFDEIYPESETKIIEKNDCRRNAQILATIIDNELKLKDIFNKSFKQLGYNTCYWAGVSEVCRGRKKN